MKQSTDRILTTHVGSLPRPTDLLDLMKERATDGPHDPAAYVQRVRSAVAESVRQQMENGIDIVTDGEQGKVGFFAYVQGRLTGFEPQPNASIGLFQAEVAAFPEYYEQYFRQSMIGGSVASVVPLMCTGPVTYCGHEALRIDLENLTAALEGAKPEDVFMPAVAPSGVGRNAYYRSEEEYFHAVAEALRTEYQAIVDAGFILQIDDPWLTDLFAGAAVPVEERDKRAEMFVEAINAGLRGIPPDRVRFHTCYGINEGPRIHDAALRDIVPVMLKIRAGAYSFEAANPRHEHEYHIWETINLPDDKILIPGVVTHWGNIVEHPELIAERIVRYAKLVGREKVIAGADCGFSSQATYHPEVHPTVMWAKFRAMAEGARLATEQLWP
jgi:5-methyltetrahydropteroyltriglutamate--homocysteine methyltransferase